jgi:hypothetical protein
MTDEMIGPPGWFRGQAVPARGEQKGGLGLG